MLRIIPFAVALLGIVSLTIVEGINTDRWIDDSRNRAYCGSLIHEIPLEFGDWVGKSREVDEEVQKVAGAKSYLSCNFTNKQTGKNIGVWLVMGHAKDTSLHEPSICYPASGFTTCQRREHYEHTFESGETNSFRTSMFSKDEGAGEFGERVFWTWYLPNKDEPNSIVEWGVPKSNPRWYYGNERILYKLYFTNRTDDLEEEAKDSVCMEFAEEFFSIVNPLFAKAEQQVPEDFVIPESKPEEEKKSLIPEVEEQQH